MHFFPHLSGLSAPHSPLHCSALGMHAPSHSLKFLSFSGRHLSPHFFGFTAPHFPWHCSSLAMHWPSHSCSFGVANSRQDLLAITIIHAESKFRLQLSRKAAQIWTNRKCVTQNMYSPKQTSQSISKSLTSANFLRPFREKMRNEKTPENKPDTNDRKLSSWCNQ